MAQLLGHREGAGHGAKTAAISRRAFASRTFRLRDGRALSDWESTAPAPSGEFAQRRWRLPVPAAREH